MILRIFNHFQLSWRLFRDQRISGWLKFFLIILPLAYTALPFPGVLPVPDDFLCLIGLLDDLLLFVVTTLIFNALCPQSIVQEHINSIAGRPATLELQFLEAYRHPHESRDLASGFAFTVVLAVLGGYLAGILLLAWFAIGSLLYNMRRGQLFAHAVQVTPHQLPDLYTIFQRARVSLPISSVNLFVTQNPRMNAYTFGIDEPYSVVLTSALVERLNADEIQAVIGHELGHILFGHTRVMSILSTQLGLGTLLFYKWSRSCEYSADAAAFIASGKDAHPMISSLLHLASGLRQAIDIQAFLAQLRNDSSRAASQAELLSTHPFMHNRIIALLKLV